MPSVFITSVELMRTFPLGLFARFGGCLFVERRSPAGLKREIGEIEQVLSAGTSVVLFPEGTRRSEAADVGEFKAGIAHLVERQPGLAVVPCWLANMGRTLPKGELVPVPFICRVSLGAPLQPSGSRAEILATLEHCDGDKKKAADGLKISRNTLYNRLNEYKAA